jgi:hypothetical protein
MKPRKAPAPTRGDAMPLELVAGACIEVWAPGDALEARHRYRQARRQWNNEHGIAGPVRSNIWSYDFIRQRYGQECLADMLRSRGLPPDWEPVYVGDSRPGDEPTHAPLGR